MYLFPRARRRGGTTPQEALQVCRFRDEVGPAIPGSSRVLCPAVPEGGDNFSVTVALVTRNRKTELRKALHSVLEQDASPEVVVLDDASTDGTSEMLREEFPSVSVHRQEHALGTTLARNLVTSLAGGDIVVHLDDDARFPSRTTVSQTVADFDHPRVAIVAIPFFDVVERPAQRASRQGPRRRDLDPGDVHGCRLRGPDGHFQACRRL